MSNRSLGQAGEQVACRHLQSLGYRILDTNYRTSFGEIDIVARIGNTIHFVEVKTRSTGRHGAPYEAVNYYKRLHMYRSAMAYVLKKGYKSHTLSLDVVSIMLTPSMAVEKLQFFTNITQ